MTDDLDFDLLAASLRADTRDLAAFVEALAAKLEGALPAATRVARRSRGLLSREKRVAVLEVDLGEERYLLDHDQGAVQTRCATAVRGVVLKTEQVALEEWLERLARSIAAEARRSEQGRHALERLLGAAPGA